MTNQETSSCNLPKKSCVMRVLNTMQKPWKQSRALESITNSVKVKHGLSECISKEKVLFTVFHQVKILGFSKRPNLTQRLFILD